MAQRKDEAWLTSAWDDASLVNAMVLAESIRRTKSTRMVALITSSQIATENCVALHTTFDSVFCMDWVNATPSLSKLPGNVKATFFAFSLNVFDKCVYLSPNSLFLENADKLLEHDEDFKSLVNAEDGSLDLSLFVFKPNKSLWISILEYATGFTNGENLSNILKKQSGFTNIGTISTSVVAKLCLHQDSLLTDQVHVKIVQIIGDQMDKGGFQGKLLSLTKSDIGIREMVISKTWLQIFEEKVSPTLKHTNVRSLSLNTETDHADKFINEPIAIIGMSCRYPGANSVEEFWKLLYQGEDGVREPPAFRWTKEHSIRVTPLERQTNAGFLSTKVDEFDARFFGVSPKEAAYMDPQTRLLHEVLWESLENAGIDPLGLHGTHTGIFTGSWMNDYKDILQSSTERDFFRTYMGNSIGAAAARLSFLLGLTGPSIATESGCSAAIVALDLAVKSLRNGETNLAMAAGVNLLLHPFTSDIMDFVISPTGRCKTFDAKADGFGRAEGCGVLVLKRLSDALRDRDNIWAMVRGSAVAQEGMSRSLGTPTVHCEALAMKLAMEDANVQPEQVSFVETHGTGTAVGDPMEVAAIAKAYYSPRRENPLVIGSVKTNVGHTESCSGITGIIKTVLAMQHEIIPKHLNLESLNPEIFLESIPATIPLEPVPWPKVTGKSRIAGVSSFGITGTDGHVIIQETPDIHLPTFNLGLERPTHILKISGKTREALDDLLIEYENLFKDTTLKQYEDDKLFANAAFTGNVGRASFNHRAFIIANDSLSAAKALKEKQFIEGEVRDGEIRQICFLFTGQGSQYQGMGKMLYETCPIFRIHFDICERTLKETYTLSIKRELWEAEPGSKELSRTIYSQVSIFCVEYCLLKLWESWGIKPDYVLGHSLGEFCAAVAAGILDFKDALKLVVDRSSLIDSLPRGSMLVIKASKPEVVKMMQDAKIDLDFAAVNYPEQTVVSGDTERVEALLSHLKSEGVKAVVLEATHAFHSRHMGPILEKYRKIAKSINYKQGNGTQFISGLEGEAILDCSEINANYWVRHTRDKVSFINACAAVRDLGCHDFLEIGPQPVLSSFVMMNNEGFQLNCFPSIRRGAEDWNTILTSLGKLYLLGYAVDWKEFDKPYIRNKTSLPFHPYHKKSFWMESSGNQTTVIHPLIGHQISNASTLNIFQSDVTLKSLPYLNDHCIGEITVFPGAGYTEMCLSAGYCVSNGLTEAFEPPRRAMKLENMRIEAPLEMRDGKACRFQVLVELPESNHNQSENPLNDQGFQVKVYHQNVRNEETGKWVLHASSTFTPVASTKDSLKIWDPDRIAKIISDQKSISTDAYYKRVDDAGLKFGENFRMLKRYWVLKNPDPKLNADEIVAEMEVPSDHNKYLLHPLIIDAGFQSGILTRIDYSGSKLKVPVRIGQLTMFSEVNHLSGNGTLYLHAFLRNEKYHVFICTPDFTPIAHIEDVELVDTNVKTIKSVLELQSSIIPDVWEETWKVIPAPFSSAIDLVDLDMAFENPDLLQKLEELQDTPDDVVELFRKMRRLTSLYILNALLEIGWLPKIGQTTDAISFCEELGIQPSFRQLVRFYFTVLQEEPGIFSEVKESNQWKICALPPSLEEIKREMGLVRKALEGTNVDATAKVLENVSLNLSKILTGNESALQLLFPVDEDKQHLSAESFYKNHPGKNDITGVTTEACVAICRQALLENGEDTGKICRVLEVGAGTGSLSIGILRTMRKLWGERFEFYYTDISQSFFIKAEKLFDEYRENLKYAVFNIEESPLSQGIPLEYFDLVTATDVLHATRNLEETLVHIRQTLRPGAVLVFTETVVESWDITCLFGLLDGYWRFEDSRYRTNHCCVSEQVWEQLLYKCGFQMVRNFKAYVDEFACIAAFASSDVKLDTLRISSYVEPEKDLVSRKDWIIFSEESSLEVTSQLGNMLKASGYNVKTIQSKASQQKDWDFMEECANMRMIQPDKEDPTEIEAVLKGARDGKIQGIIYAWGMNAYETDQRKTALPLMHIIKSVIWQQKPPQLYILTEGVHSITEDSVTYNPSGATLFGMAKSLKNENTNYFVRCVDLEYGSSPKVIVDRVLFELAMSKGSREQQRVQVAYRGNLRYEPRLLKGSLPTSVDELKLPPSTDRYQLKLPKTKAIQDLEFDVLEECDLEEDEVEIKIKAYALNFRDIFAVLKPSAEFDSINNVGLDLAGVVTRAGSSTKYKVGDRVFGANNFKDAQLPSHLTLSTRNILSIPEGMTFWEAATLPAVFSTAYYCLITIAKMTSHDTVLIHTGSGGVGLAAIQLAQHVGATIVTTAGNKRKRAYLRSLGIQHVFHSRDTSFEKNILEVTNGHGVDIVLNSITGPGIKEATLNATAKNGRFIEMSKLSIWSVDEVKALRVDVHYEIVDLTKLDVDEWGQLLVNLEDHVSKGQFQPIPYVKFDALNIRQALQYFQKAKHIGKVVCSMPNVTKEEGQFKVKVDLFNRESTYLITGGLGGIGMEVCKWMLERGATDIVLTGRSLPKPEVISQIKELNGNGANVTVRLGDVGNYSNLKSIIDEIRGGEKPLRGVMHCAGVLRDNLYSNQTWDSFEATFSSKVSGTWNLHHLTSDLPLEHFIMFSSVTALVGTVGQPNHSAANCFEDAFIHYRHSLGLPGTSINWGQWAQVGVAKEINVLGLFPVSTKRMLNGLELTMKTQKKQVGLCDFESLVNVSMMCPLIKFYMDERLWKQMSGSSPINEVLKAEQFWKDIDEKESKEEKSEVMTAYIKSILRSALRLEPDEPLNDDANIQELGVDSLMMIELKNSIQGLLGTRVNVTQNLLKNCTTIRLISAAVVGKLLEEESEDEDVSTEPLLPAELIQLLTDDSVLDENISNNTNSIPKPSQIKTLLITGVTGNLAPYLISNIVESQNMSVERIICLVKGATNDTPEIATEKLKSSFKLKNLHVEGGRCKLECISGDVAKDHLGLLKEDYDDLCGQVDAVIHCAAKVHHSEHYRNSDNGKHTNIRSINVGGTLNILKFASSVRTKLVYYPSSFLCGIFEENDEKTLPDDWPNTGTIRTIVNSKVPGLLTSNFICELLMKQANERGIPCKVFRFPWITGESKTGRLNYLNNLYILRFLSFLKLNAMPSLAFPANFLPVDKCAELSMRLFFNDEVPHEIFNIGHPQPQVEQEFVSLAKEEYGRDLNVLTWKEFTQLIEENESSIEAELRNLYRDQKTLSTYMAEAVGFAKGYLISPDKFFTNPKILQYIPDYGDEIPSSMDILRKDLDYLKSTGFLDKFGI